MAFGQPSGPPASAKQVRELLELLQAAGHSDFRDARGPMGFNQRQAGGKFSRDEVDAFITRLQDEAEHSGDSAPPTETPTPTTAPKHVSHPKKVPVSTTRVTPEQRAIKNASDADLAAELQSRGWIVMAP